MSKKIYLDFAGTTPMDPLVERVVLAHLRNTWGNASSIHRVGRQARQVIDDSCKSVSKIIGSRSEEIIFTGSGTEANNLAIFGIARAYKKYGRFTRHGFSKKNLGGHILISKIEHPSIIEACKYLQKNEGFEVEYLDVGKDGLIDTDRIKKSLRPETILVSIIYANNEIGTIQSIAKITKVIKEFKKQNQVSHLFFHTDACQAAGVLNLNVNQLGVDLMTINGSKLYGPKGVGCLYHRRGIDMVPIIFGGTQEYGLRAGTENVALIAGFAKSLEIADKNKEKTAKKLLNLRDYMIGVILKSIPDSKLNGDSLARLPNNINVSFEGIDGEMLMLALDQRGIQVSTGSACTSTSTEPSHVMKAIGLPDSLVRGNIRMTLGQQTTKKDIDYVLKVLPGVVKKLHRGHL